MIPDAPSYQGRGAARYGASPRQRVLSFVLALATSALVFFVMIRMGAFGGLTPDRGGRLVAVDLSRAKGDSQEKTEKPHQQARAEQQAQQQQAPARQVMPPRVEVPTENKAVLPPGFIVMSREDFAASDISRMRRSADAGSAGSSAPSGGGAADGAGEGPGGARLYAAQWYREPTDAEIGGYMPANRPPGAWAIIACRTVEKYHVEDCREMDESPRGSGLARALRQAAWQFLVRPPRIDGKAQLGVWVRIRFDFKRTKRDAGGGAPEDGVGDGR